MVAYATLQFPDRETTPVMHNFLPNPPINGNAFFSEAGATGVLANDNTLLVQVKKGTKNRVRLLFSMPVVQTEVLNGISSPKLLRTAYGEVNLTFDRLSTLQERKNLVAMLFGALNSTHALDNVVTKLENFY